MKSPFLILLTVIHFSALAQTGKIERRDTVLKFSFPFDLLHPEPQRLAYCDDGPPCYVRFNYPGTNIQKAEFFRLDQGRYRYKEYARDSSVADGDERTTGILRVSRFPLDSSVGYVENPDDGSQLLERCYSIGFLKEGKWSEFPDPGTKEYWVGNYRDGMRIGVWMHSENGNGEPEPMLNYEYPATDSRHYFGDIVHVASTKAVRTAILGSWSNGCCGAGNLGDPVGRHEFIPYQKHISSQSKDPDNEEADWIDTTCASVDFLVNGRFRILYRGGCDRSDESPTGGHWRITEGCDAFQLKLRFKDGRLVVYRLQRMIPGGKFLLTGD